MYFFGCWRVSNSVFSRLFGVFSCVKCNLSTFTRKRKMQEEHKVITCSKIVVFLCYFVKTITTVLDLDIFDFIKSAYPNLICCLFPISNTMCFFPISRRVVFIGCWCETAFSLRNFYTEKEKKLEEVCEMAILHSERLSLNWNVCVSI